MTGPKRPADAIRAIAERERAKGGEKPPAAPAATGKVIRLPLVPEAAAGMSNLLLRTAMFGVVRPGRRRILDDEPIASLGGTVARYTGKQLDQNDLIALHVGLHFARTQPLGELVRFTGADALDLLGWTDTGKNRDLLHERLVRLRGAGLTLQSGKVSFSGGLITTVVRDERESKRHFDIRVNPDTGAIFAADQWTALDWGVRRDLGDRQLAQWLYGFFWSHAQPHPVRAETLHKLCGSTAADLADWRKKELRRSLEHVRQAVERQGGGFEWKMLGDLVTVAHSGTGTQRRHRLRRVLGGTEGGDSGED